MRREPSAALQERTLHYSIAPVLPRPRHRRAWPWRGGRGLRIRRRNGARPPVMLGPGTGEATGPTKRMRTRLPDPADEITGLLARCQAGDAAARDRITPIVYAELKALAARALQRERAGHTLQTTALVNEACLRLLGQRELEPGNQAQLLALAAQAMRRVLVDHARRRNAAKRPGSNERIAIEEIDLPEAELDLVGLDEALSRLGTINPRQARVVDLKFFAGLELEQIADVLEIARPTVVRDWRMARAWLQRELA